MTRREKLMFWVAWRLPSDLVNFCGIRVAAHATSGKFGGNPANLTFDETFRRWDDARGGDKRRSRELTKEAPDV
jgi:hypothetical protein